jgi:hypothetical protein
MGFLKKKIKAVNLKTLAKNILKQSEEKHHYGKNIHMMENKKRLKKHHNFLKM